MISDPMNPVIDQHVFVPTDPTDPGCKQCHYCVFHKRAHANQANPLKVSDEELILKGVVSRNEVLVEREPMEEKVVPLIVRSKQVGTAVIHQGDSGLTATMHITDPDLVQFFKDDLNHISFNPEKLPRKQRVIGY